MVNLYLQHIRLNPMELPTEIYMYIIDIHTIYIYFPFAAHSILLEKRRRELKKNG